ncbi:MAG: hypothetical protein Q8M15_11640 [Bacteroidota bacterium]|nr:hypothetical protein [Bacteroidota bacterium]
MKNRCLIIFLLFSIKLMAQYDSTSIKIEYLDADMTLINELNEIQFIGLKCSDRKMKGKKFLLTFREYENGKLIVDDTSRLICEDRNIPMFIGTDTMYYFYNTCSGSTFQPDDSVYRIKFAGKLQGVNFKLLIAWVPGFELSKQLKGNSDYSLRTIHNSEDNEMKVRLNTVTPILTYTPPYEFGAGAKEYCILDGSPIEDWYSKYKIKHFYIISLKIL